jgi:hypothetical protein
MATIGAAPCIICKCEIPIKENDAGTLSFSCGYCDVTIYSKKNTASHKTLLKLVKRTAPDPEAAAAAPEVATAAAPARSAPAASSVAKMPWVR